jgi:hypothetical protein
MQIFSRATYNDAQNRLKKDIEVTICLLDIAPGTERMASVAKKSHVVIGTGSDQS